MIQIKDPKECCGCTACASICTHDAITMKPDALGFLYPEVDFKKCIGCGLCEKVCVFNSDYEKSHLLEKPATYGARHKDINELKYSRSGAIFVALSDYVLNKNGVIYGAGYTDHFRVVHKRATTKDDRNEFKGSKYVQSDIRGVLPQVKNDLQRGKLVLFSGTPCQTAAVYSFVGKRYRENLILVDIVCHAVPSPYIWRDYLTAVEKKAKSRAVAVYFRDKTYGWAASHNERFVFENGKQFVSYIHRDLFYKNLSTRLSCHNCKYCNLQRPSDITIGDFWGYENTEAKYMNEDGNGVSLIIVNSHKGIEILNNIRDNIFLKETQLQSSLQPNLCNPTPLSRLRDEFEENYRKHGFEFVARLYSDWSVSKQAIKRISFYKNIIINKIKSFICI